MKPRSQSTIRMSNSVPSTRPIPAAAVAVVVVVAAARAEQQDQYDDDENRAHDSPSFRTCGANKLSRSATSLNRGGVARVGGVKLLSAWRGDPLRREFV